MKEGAAIGYVIDTIDSHVRIPKAKIPAAEQAIRNTWRVGDIVNADISVVQMEEESLLVEAAFMAGFSEAQIDENGDFSLNGYHAKVGEVDAFLIQIAPFVEDGSYLTWRGEDDEMFADVFMNGQCWPCDITIRIVPPKISESGYATPDEIEALKKIHEWVVKQGVE